MVRSEDDPKYPKEWVSDADGNNPRCTAREVTLAMWAKSDPREGDDMSKWPEPRPIAEAPKLECILAYVPESSDPHLKGRWLLMAATEDKEKLMGLPFSVQIPLRIDGFRARFCSPPTSAPATSAGGAEVTKEELDIIEHATGEITTRRVRNYLPERTARISRCAVHRQSADSCVEVRKSDGARTIPFHRHRGGRA